MKPKQYLITEELRMGLIEYLGTRPLKEVFDGWMALRNLTPLDDGSHENEPLPTLKDSR